MHTTKPYTLSEIKVDTTIYIILYVWMIHVDPDTDEKRCNIYKWYVAMHALNDYTYFHECLGFYTRADHEVANYAHNSLHYSTQNFL